MTQVSGVVQRDGKVVSSGRVLFRPLGEEKPAYGVIQPDGAFEMTTDEPGDGVMIGRYQVVIAGGKGVKDPALRATYMGPRDKPVNVVAGKNELVIDIREEDGWQKYAADD
jgi:hypothetical protein